MIEKTGNKLVDLSDIVMNSIAKAELNMSNLSEDILDFEKEWSSPKMRHFLNNLCSNKEIVYFECGLARGSTLISALYGNKVFSYGCDLWLEEKLGANSYEAFVQNCSHFKEDLPLEKFTLFNGSCWNLHEENLAFSPKPNVIFYDAGHSIEDHKKAMTYFFPLMDEEFVMIIDDFEDDRVMSGINQGLAEMYEKIGVCMVSVIQLRGFPPHSNIWNDGGRKPKSKWSDHERWGNGVWVALFSKQSTQFKEVS